MVKDPIDVVILLASRFSLSGEMAKAIEVIGGAINCDISNKSRADLFLFRATLLMDQDDILELADYTSCWNLTPNIGERRCILEQSIAERFWRLGERSLGMMWADHQLFQQYVRYCWSSLGLDGFPDLENFDETKKSLREALKQKNED